MAQRASFSYRKTEAADSHLKMVISSLGLVQSSKKLSKREIFIRRVIAAVVIFLLVSYGLSPLFVRADAVTFYPSACLGGWSGVHLAENEGETSKGTSDFSLSNSASLSKETATDIYCGTFKGVIPENTTPKEVTLTVLWKALSEEESSPLSGTSFASSSLDILDATSTVDFVLDTSTTTATSTEEIEVLSEVTTQIEERKEETSTTTEPVAPTGTNETPTETVPAVETQSAPASEPVVENTSTPEPTPTPTPTPEPTPVSTPEPASAPAPESPQTFLDKSLESMLSFFAQKVFAEEEGATTTPIASSTTPETSIEIASSTEVGTTTEATTSEVELISNPIFEISYTLDGESWFVLKSVTAGELQNLEMNVPLELNGKWDDISNVQIKIKSLPSIDEKPAVLLDGMFLSVSYDEIKNLPKEESVFGVPDTEKGDIILSEISSDFDLKTIFLVERSLIKEVSSATSTATSTDNATTTTEVSTSIVLELWVKDETSMEWKRIADNNVLAKDPNIKYEEGKVSWLAKEENMVWSFDLHNSSYSFIPVSDVGSLGNKDENLNLEIPAVVEEVREQTKKELKVRKIKRVAVVDKKAIHSCEADMFQVDITGKSSSSFKILVSKNGTSTEELEIGSLPIGIDIVFQKNNDYKYTPALEESILDLSITNEEGSQKGNFSVPIIYTSKNAKDSTTICQINIVNH